MSSTRIRTRRFIISLIVILILALSFVLSVVAQSPGRDTSTPPDTVTDVDQEELNHNVALQEPELRDSGPAPDVITVVTEEEMPSSDTEQVGWFHFISANTFVPYDDNMTYTYYSSGCMYRTGGGAFTEHTLQLPQGAEIDFVRIFFYDNDPTHDASVSLDAYDGWGNTTHIKTVASEGVPGQSSVGSGGFSYMVNNEAEALSLSFNYGGASTYLLRICGVRIRYQYNYFGMAMPFLQK